MSDNGTETVRLPRGWVRTTLGAITEPTRPRQNPQDSPNLPFIGMEHIEPHTMRLLRTVPAHTLKSIAVHFWPGDILYGRLRPYLNKVYRPDFEGLCSAEFIVFPSSLSFETRYLQYLLNSTAFVSFASHLNEGERPRVDFGMLKSYPVPLSPFSEQTCIVEEIESRFSQLEAGVAALERAKTNLKNYRASVLQAACEGRLVPTEAELARTEGREYEPADQLLTRILKERLATWEAEQLAKMEAQGEAPKDDKWKAKYKEPFEPDTSELPELSEGWVWATWEQLSMRVTVGHVGPMRHEYVQDGVPFLRSQNVRENRFDPTGLLYISPTFHKRLSKSTLHPGDLVVVRSGGVGVTCVIPESLGEANCSDLVIIQKPLGLNSQYGSFFMNSVAKGAVEAGQVGIALTHFNTRSVATLSVAVPPLVEQRRIVTEVENRLSILDKLEVAIMANLKRAERLRQAVLKQAFEGELVPQDPNDEPASVLLERIRQERARKAEEETAKRKPARKKMAKTKRATSKRGKQVERQPLLEVLNSAAGHLTPEQLFNQSGYTPEDIEEFYEELNREVLAQRIEQERPNDTEVYLRVVGE